MMQDFGLRWFRRIVRPGIVLGLSTISAALAVRGETVSLSTPWLELQIDRGSGQIVAFVDSASRQNFSYPVAGGNLWELELAGAPPIKLCPTNALACRVDKLGGPEPGLRLVWSQFEGFEASPLRVEVTVRLDRKQPLSRWRLAVETPGGRAIERIRFPRIHSLPRLERERLAVPFWAGLLADKPRQIFTSSSPGGVRQEYDYPGLCSMQCLTFYSDAGPGLYAACDDVAGYRKLFAVFSPGPTPLEWKAGTGPGPEKTVGAASAPDLGLELVHLPDRREATRPRYVLPYSALLGTFHGNWFEAAAIYRAWATNQVWARESRWKRGRVPSWIADTGLWIWNRGRSPEVVDPAIVMQRELGLPVSLFWHWWHGCAYDTGFPEYLPPREGEASFAAALGRAHDHEVRALVYMNQRLWGMTTASWTNENAAAFAVKAADGQVKPEVYNSFTKSPCASMCLGTDFWRTKYAGLATEAFRRLGVDGIYMDQACSSLSCFNPHHGHPPGGGAYWMSGFKSLVTTLRQRCADRGGIALAGEGCAENWLPHLDLMLALDVSRERYCAPDGWDPIPLFQAVYHGYTTFFGSYSSLTTPPYDDLWPAEFAPKQPLELLDRQFSRQFILEQARAFVWGQQPTLANFRPEQLRERSVEIAYVIRLARLRRLALKYLQDGTMLSPPTIEAPDEEVPMSRLSIYAGQQDSLKSYSKRIPLVLASAWRAADGSVAIVAANVADRSLTAKILFDPARSGLRKPGRFDAIAPPGAPPKCGPGTDALQLDLAPLQARVFEWRTER